MTLTWSPQALLLLATVAAHAVFVVWAVRRGPLSGKPLLSAIAALAAVPAVTAAVLEIAPFVEAPLRFQRAWAIPLTSASTLFCLTRLATLPLRGKFRTRLVWLATSAGVLAAALSVAEPEIGGRLQRLAVILLVDRSRSTELVPAVAARLASEQRVAEIGMRPDDTIGVVVFGAAPALEEPLRAKTTLPSPARVEVGRDATDIEAAIRRGLAEVPADAAARLVLLSDGVATRGDALDAAAAGRVAEVPVDVVPLDQRKLKDIRVVSARLPHRASDGEAVDLRVIVQSPERTEVQVRVLRDGELVRSAKTAIAAGEDVLSIREMATEPGLHRYDVQITATDAALDELSRDNEASTFLRVEGRSRALILDNSPSAARPLADALRAAAFDVAVAPAAGAPADVAELSAYDLVVLSDLPAADLAPTQLDALGSYVSTLGGGLLLLGGPRGLGPGGYGATAVERVSPVSFDLKQSRRRASLAEVILIDFSGSMAANAGARTKLDLANEAAARSAALLGAGDRVGVFHVDDTVHVTVPLGPADRDGVGASIRKVRPGGGGIFVDLSLRAAYEALDKESVNLKHVLLFADGSDAEEKQHAEALVRSAASRKITTSVVALGKGPDVPALEQLSREGAGRFYLIEDASRLPAVFAQETIAATQSAINEVAFRPTPSSPGRAIRGIDWAASPELTAYVVTLPKSRSEIALRGPENDPLLATWTAGVGHAAAFTSDFKGVWSGEFVAWPGAAQLFAQLARELARREGDRHLRVETQTGDGRLAIRAEAVRDDGRADSFRHLVARIGGPDGFEQTVTLDPTQAGAYGANVPLDRPGAYVVSVTEDATVVATAATVFSSADEMRPTGTDREALRRIAQVSDGKVRDTLAGIFDDRASRRFAYDPISGFLLALAGFSLLVSVGGRRAGMPEFVARLVERTRERLRRRPPRRRVVEAATATALLSAKAARRAKYPTPRKPLAPARVEALSTASPPTSGSDHERRAPGAVAAPPPATEPREPKGAPPKRGLTSAEILLARRRNRR